MRRLRRTAGAALLAVVLTAGATGCRGVEDTNAPRQSAPTAAVIPSESPISSGTRSSDSTDRSGPVLGPAEARVALTKLQVLPRRPYVAGYQRSCSPGAACSFGPAWTDDNNDSDGHNGCDTRNDVLAEQLTDVTYRRGSRCVVEAGLLHDPYTGATLEFRKARAQLEPVDHVVPLALAWDLGASRWSQQQRVDYANDTRLVLLLVDEASNEAKSDSGPAEWMPPNRSDWCAYGERFVSVLSHYQLPVTAADRDAMRRVLATC